jgi:hypothetical protein
MDGAPRSRAREALVNIGLMAASTLVFLAFCELVVFRVILPAGDVPANAFINDVVRYEPDQKGVWRVRDEIAAPFSINVQGWNSALRDYPVDKKEGITRIAFIGDSYVEALQVPVERSFAETTAQALSADARAEPYRFAVSGAPLSQYVQMVEREAVRFRPDAIVVLLIHNDFDESFLLKAGRYTSSFLKFDVRDGQVRGEIPPQPWKASAMDVVRRSATVRFFLYRWQVRPQALIEGIVGGARASDQPTFAANIDVASTMSRQADIKAATAHGFTRLADLARSVGATLYLVMDGDRGAIQSGAQASPALALNEIAAEAARAQGLRFLDLHPVFATDWAKNRQRLDFPSDGHWSQHAHNVAGRAVADFMRSTQ